MPISKKTTIEYDKVKLYDQPDVYVTTINSKNNLHCLQWTTNNWTHKYNGNIFKECEHGVGTYTWNETLNKTVYEGKFYANNLHGYGRVSYDDGSIFEGLFKMNLRFGPGIFTYCNGEQDIGMWDASYLVRLSQIIYPEWVPKLGTTMLGKARMLRYRKIIPIERNVVPKSHSNGSNQSFSLYSDCVRDVNSTFFNKPQFDDIFINKNAFYIDVIVPDNYTKLKVDDRGIVLLENDKKDDKILIPTKMNKIKVNNLVAWNNNDFSLQILLFTFLNREMESLMTPNIRKMLSGDRTTFRSPGIIEQHSVLYLKYCSEGNVKHLERLIYKFHVYPNVCDAKGNSGIIYAASRDQHNVIKLLCNLGVDFNQFNDESLTALNIALLRYISKLNKIHDWELAFILPVACYLSQFDTGKLIEWNSCQSKARINVVNNLNDDQSFPYHKNSTNILYWMKSESKLLENYNYINLPRQNDKVMPVHKRTCIFVFTPVVSVKRPYMDEKLKKAEKQKRKSPTTRRPCFKKAPLPSTEPKVSKPSGGENVTNGLLLSELQNKSLEDIEQTVLLLLKGGSTPEKCSVPLATIFLGIVSLNSNIVEALLKCKADPNSRSPECIGFLTPLHFVMSLKPCRELLEITKLLLEYGAEPNLRASSNHWSVLKADIKHPNILDDSMGMTTLHLLCIRHDLDADISGYSLALAKLLLMYKANPDLLYMGHTALSLAMINGKKFMVKALLETRMVNPNQKLADEIGVPLTLYLNSGYFQFLPIEVCIAIMCLITEYGANPLNMVDDDINCLEFVRVNKSLSRQQSEIWPNTTILFPNIRKKCYIQTVKTTLTIKDNDNKSDDETRKLNYFYTLEQHLHELANLAMENYIFGIVVRQIYDVIDKPLDAKTLKYIKNISQNIEIPNFEKTTEIFGKMADANINLDKDKVKATLEFALYRDYIETEQLSDDTTDQDGESKTTDTKNLNQSDKKSYSTNKSRVCIKQNTKDQNDDDETSHVSKHNLDKLVDYITELSKKDNKFNDESKFHMYYPEYEPATYKYNICFECHRRKDVELLTCPTCEIVKFCSRKCNINNNARGTIHKCNTVFYHRLSTDDLLDNLKSPTKPPESLTVDGSSPGKDKNIPTHQKCDDLELLSDFYDPNAKVKWDMMKNLPRSTRGRGIKIVDSDTDEDTSDFDLSLNGLNYNQEDLKQLDPLREYEVQDSLRKACGIGHSNRVIESHWRTEKRNISECEIQVDVHNVPNDSDTNVIESTSLHVNSNIESNEEKEDVMKLSRVSIEDSNSYSDINIEAKTNGLPRRTTYVHKPNTEIQDNKTLPVKEDVASNSDRREIDYNSEIIAEILANDELENGLNDFYEYYSDSSDENIIIETCDLDDSRNNCAITNNTNDRKKGNRKKYKPIDIDIKLPLQKSTLIHNEYTKIPSKSPVSFTTVNSVLNPNAREFRSFSYNDDNGYKLGSKKDFPPLS